MKTYRIALDGCDDSTVVETPLTDGQFNLLAAVAGLSHGASKNGCQPRLYIEEIA